VSYLTPCRVPRCDIPGDSYAGVKGAVGAGLVLQSHCRNIATIGVILLGRNTVYKWRENKKTRNIFLAMKKRQVQIYQLTKFRYSFAVLVLSRLLVLSMFLSDKYLCSSVREEQGL
jgi:hypothetical protein